MGALGVLSGSKIPVVAGITLNLLEPCNLVFRQAVGKRRIHVENEVAVGIGNGDLVLEVEDELLSAQTQLMGATIDIFLDGRDLAGQVGVARVAGGKKLGLVERALDVVVGVLNARFLVGDRAHVAVGAGIAHLGHGAGVGTIVELELGMAHGKHLRARGGIGPVGEAVLVIERKRVFGVHAGKTAIVGADRLAGLERSVGALLHRGGHGVIAMALAAGCVGHRGLVEIVAHGANPVLAKHRVGGGVLVLVAVCARDVLSECVLILGDRLGPIAAFALVVGGVEMHLRSLAGVARNLALGLGKIAKTAVVCDNPHRISVAARLGVVLRVAVALTEGLNLGVLVFIEEVDLGGGIVAVEKVRANRGGVDIALGDVLAVLKRHVHGGHEIGIVLKGELVGPIGGVDHAILVVLESGVSDNFLGLAVGRRLLLLARSDSGNAGKSQHTCQARTCYGGESRLFDLHECLLSPVGPAAFEGRL